MTNSILHQTRIKLFVEAARDLVETRWHHGQRMPGVGTDCVGVVAISCSKAGYKHTDIQHYSKYPDGELLIKMMEEQFDQVELDERSVGDIAVFKIRKVPQHVGVFTDHGLVHAWMGVGRVVEHTFDDAWLKRLTHVFRLREDRWLPLP